MEGGSEGQGGKGPGRETLAYYVNALNEDVDLFTSQGGHSHTESPAQSIYNEVNWE